MSAIGFADVHHTISSPLKLSLPFPFLRNFFLYSPGFGSCLSCLPTVKHFQSDFFFSHGPQLGSPSGVLFFLLRLRLPSFIPSKRETCGLNSIESSPKTSALLQLQFLLRNRFFFFLEPRSPRGGECLTSSIPFFLSAIFLHFDLQVFWAVPPTFSFQRYSVFKPVLIPFPRFFFRDRSIPQLISPP